MVKANKWRSRSAAPNPYAHTAKKAKHADMTSLMKEEDRKALSFNKYEATMTLFEL